MKKAPADTLPTEDKDPLQSLPSWFTEREIIPLEDQLALVVCHETMQTIVALCRSLAENPAPVLLTGETGVGKSLLCRFIHASRDPYAPYVSMLAAGLGPEVLLERLFGPVPPEGPAPLLEEAHGGSLVLEEMGDLPVPVQRRLLEYWDEGGPAGEDNGARPAQMLFTTNTPAERLAGPGGLLPEFLERLRRIHVPPLRERKEDIPALVAYFARIGASRRDSLKGLEQLAERLAGHSFPGNVRELESLMALETGGLPWRWRITGADKGYCLRTPVAKSAKTKPDKAAPAAPAKGRAGGGKKGGKKA